MAGLFESQVEQVVRDGLSRVLDANREAWICQVAKNWDFYKGNQIAYITKYPGETVEEFDAKRKAPFNYTKLIVNEYIAGVYQEPVRRTFNSDTNNEILKDISKSFQFDPFYRKVQLIAEVSEMCAVIIREDKAKKNIFLEAVPGQFVKIHPDSSYADNIGHVIIGYEFDHDVANEGPGLRVEGWSRDRIVIIEKIGDKTRVIFNEENKLRDENDVPLIPITFFRPEDAVDSPYGDSNIETVVEINHAYNTMWMDIMRTVQLQQSSLLVMKRPTDDDSGEDAPQPIQVAPNRLLDLTNKDSDAKYITPSPLINESLNALDTLKKEMLDLSSVPMEAIGGGIKNGVESAEALRIRSIPIQKAWNNRKASYGASDIELNKKLILFHYNVKNTGDLNDLIATIDYSENAMPITFEEKQKQEIHDLEIGLTNPVEIMLNRDPDMGSEEDAKERVLKNKEITKEILGPSSVDDFLEKAKNFRQTAHEVQDKLK